MTNRPQRASAPQTWALTALALALQSVPVLAQAPGAPPGPAQWASQETAAPGEGSEGLLAASPELLAGRGHRGAAAPPPSIEPPPVRLNAQRGPEAVQRKSSDVRSVRTAAAAPVSLAQASVSPAPAPAASAPPPPAHHASPMPTALSLPPCNQVTVEPAAQVTLGKSTVLGLNAPIVRMVVGGAPASRALAPVADRPASSAGLAAAAATASDGVAQIDLILLGPTELFVLGRRPGSMNLILQAADGRCFLRDVIVTVDPDMLQSKLAELLPGERQIRVRALDSALVLTGQVSDALKADEVMNLAQSLGEGRRVVNLLRVGAPAQVMLEVKIAEVSKGVLDRLGIDLTRVARTGDGARIVTGLFGGNPLLLGRTTTSNIGLSGRVDVGRGLGLDIGAGKDTVSGSAGQQGASGTLIGIDAQAQDALVRVLAEPNIMALSGQSASFLSGGKVFIPVRQGNGAVSLEERQFGVGLKFHPTVLDAGRVNLKLTTEASELSQTGASLTTADGLQSVLPTVSTRQVDTTVQLGDGQSLAIAGLIRHTVSQSLNRFPGLGDLPILGALFRSTAFQKDQTELVFVITPRLVQPLQTALLPTDVHVEPSRHDAVLGGKGEGRPAPPPSAPVPPAVQAPGNARMSEPSITEPKGQP